MVSIASVTSGSKKALCCSILLYYNAQHTYRHAPCVEPTGCIGREVEAVSFNYLRREWNILDPALAEDFKQLEKVQDAEFSVVSETSDQRTWIVTFSKDNGPSASYIYNRCCAALCCGCAVLRCAVLC